MLGWAAVCRVPVIDVAVRLLILEIFLLESTTKALPLAADPGVGISR